MGFTQRLQPGYGCGSLGQTAYSALLRPWLKRAKNPPASQGQPVRDNRVSADRPRFILQSGIVTLACFKPPIPP